MNEYTFKDSKYFDVFIKSRKTGKITTFRMCQNLDFAFNKDLGTYVLEFYVVKNGIFIALTIILLLLIERKRKRIYKKILFLFHVKQCST